MDDPKVAFVPFDGKDEGVSRVATDVRQLRLLALGGRQSRANRPWRLDDH